MYVGEKVIEKMGPLGLGLVLGGWCCRLGARGLGAGGLVLGAQG